jgi:hypothetical protein
MLSLVTASVFFAVESMYNRRQRRAAVHGPGHDGCSVALGEYAHSRRGARDGAVWAPSVRPDHADCTGEPCACAVAYTWKDAFCV